MATVINLRNGSIPKSGVVGFSWTTLFFGFFVPMFRGDWKWCLIMLLAQALTCGLAGIFFAFIYNKIYTRALLEDGYTAADERAQQVLLNAGLCV